MTPKALNSNRCECLDPDSGAQCQLHHDHPGEHWGHPPFRQWTSSSTAVTVAASPSVPNGGEIGTPSALGSAPQPPVIELIDGLYPTLFTAHPDGVYRTISLEQIRGWFRASSSTETRSGVPASPVVASSDLTPSVPNGEDSGNSKLAAPDPLKATGETLDGRPITLEPPRCPACGSTDGGLGTSWAYFICRPCGKERYWTKNFEHPGDWAVAIAASPYGRRSELLQQIESLRAALASVQTPDSELIKLLRRVAKSEAYDPNLPVTDGPDISWEELDEIAKLCGRAADALAAFRTLPPAQPEFETRLAQLAAEHEADLRETRPSEPLEACTAWDLLLHVQRKHGLVNRGDFIECSCGTTFWFSNRLRTSAAPPQPETLRVCKTCNGKRWIMKSESRDLGNGMGAGGSWNAPCPDCAPETPTE